MSRQGGLTILLVAALAALPGAAPARAGVIASTTEEPAAAAVAGASASTSAAIKRQFGVFRRKKTKRDLFPARNKKKRAEAAKIDSRLVYSAAKFKVYLYIRDNKVCITRINRSSAGGTCAPLRSYLTAIPPMVFMIDRAMEPTEVIIPAVDGVATITRVHADGTRVALAVRNNIVVDIAPPTRVHYEWRQPSGITATALKR